MVCAYASVVFGRGLRRCLSDTDGSPQLASCYIAKYIRREPAKKEIFLDKKAHILEEEETR